MIGSIKENDLITLDDNNKYFIIHTIEDFNSKFHLLIRYLDDKEEFDFDDIAFVEEADENGEIFLDPVTNPEIIKQLGAYVITFKSMDIDPEMKEQLDKALNELMNKDSQ
jgi:hypothetical protein